MHKAHAAVNLSLKDKRNSVCEGLKAVLVIDLSNYGIIHVVDSDCALLNGLCTLSGAACARVLPLFALCGS